MPSKHGRLASVTEVAEIATEITGRKTEKHQARYDTRRREFPEAFEVTAQGPVWKDAEVRDFYTKLAGEQVAQ